MMRSETLSPAESSATQDIRRSERVGYLDGWRGLAIALVLIQHFFENDALNLGRLGVNIFFCLSGLLMSQILFEKRMDLRTFYKRRISRILPSFWFYLCVVYGFSYFQGNTLGWIDFMSSLVFSRTYYPVQPDIFNTGYPLAHLWSLNVEEHCYVLLSLLRLFPFCKVKAGYCLIGMGCLSIGIYLFYALMPQYAPELDWIRTESVLSFLVIPAGYALVAERITPYVKTWMPLATLVICVFLQCKSIPHLWLISAVLTPFLLAFSINHLAQTPLLFRQVLSLAPLRLLGISSFSIYLWQQPFYLYISQQVAHDISLNCLFLAFALGVGAAMFYCLEQPLRNYLNKTC